MNVWNASFFFFFFFTAVMHWKEKHFCALIFHQLSCWVNKVIITVFTVFTNTCILATDRVVSHYDLVRSEHSGYLQFSFLFSVLPLNLVKVSQSQAISVWLFFLRLFFSSFFSLSFFSLMQKLTSRTDLVSPQEVLRGDHLYFEICMFCW